MFYRLSAVAVLLLHLCFIAFVMLGGLWVLQRRWVSLLHAPAVAWACFVELTDQVCPLTYLENYLRYRAGQSGYRQEFVEHYLIALIYPATLTPHLQLLLAALVVLVNVPIYAWLLAARSHRA